MSREDFPDGDGNDYTVSINGNSITEIKHKINNKYLYINNRYDNGVLNIKINKNAVLHKSMDTNLWELYSFNLLIYTNFPGEHLAKYYDAHAVKFNTAFLSPSDYILHTAVDYEIINQLLEQGNIKIAIIESYASYAENKTIANPGPLMYNIPDIFLELSLYMWHTQKYDVIYSYNDAKTVRPRTRINESGKYHASFLQNDINADREYGDHLSKCNRWFADEICVIIRERTEFIPTGNIIEFVPDKLYIDSSRVQQFKYPTKWDLFTNNVNYKSLSQNAETRFIVVDDNIEQVQFAKCMLKNVWGSYLHKHIIVLTDNIDDSSDEIIIYRNKNRASFLEFAQ